MRAGAEVNDGGWLGWSGHSGFYFPLVSSCFVVPRKGHPSVPPFLGFAVLDTDGRTTMRTPTNCVSCLRQGGGLASPPPPCAGENLLAVPTKDGIRLVLGGDVCSCTRCDMFGNP